MIFTSLVVFLSLVEFLEEVPLAVMVVEDSTEVFVSLEEFSSVEDSTLETFLKVVLPFEVTFGMTQVPFTSSPILLGKGFFQDGFSSSGFGFGGRKKVLSLFSLFGETSLLSLDGSSPVSEELAAGVVAFEEAGAAGAVSFAWVVLAVALVALETLVTTARLDLFR